MIFNMTGGGNPLNFKVVGGTAEPSNPKENIIWVETEKINNWYFSATQPEGLQEWDVWFRTGTSNSIEFNALKKKGIQVYPKEAKQYVSGALVDKTAKIYQNGKWVDLWSTEFLYEPGKVNTSLTGGFTAAGLAYASYATNTTVPVLNYGYDSMTITITANGAGGIVRTKNKINLTDYKELTFEGTLKAHGNDASFCGFGVWSDIGTYVNQNRVAWFGAVAGDAAKTIDISNLNGSYYIGLYMYDDESSINMRKMYLTK